MQTFIGSSLLVLISLCAGFSAQAADNIEKGKMTAIVGASGAGKSTLVRRLARDEGANDDDVPRVAHGLGGCVRWEGSRARTGSI